MNLEDLDPRNMPAKPLDLSGFGIKELQDRIALLESEIVRAKEMIAKKQGTRAAADAVFGKPGT